MQLTTLEEIKTIALPVLKEADVIKAAVFGSYVRGDYDKDSDIDMLIDMPRGKTLLDLVSLKNNLEAVLKRQVDIVEYEGIHPMIKESILKFQYPIL